MSRCCQGISLATSQPHPVVHRHSSAFLQKHTWTSRSAWPMDPGAGPQRHLRDLTSSSHVSLHDGQCRPLSLWETQHPHLRSGNPGWLHTPPQAFLLTLPTFSPLDFSLLGASTCCGFLKNSLPFSGRVRIFLQSNNSAGGWSGVTNDTLAPVWQKAPNLGFSHREMYASPQQPIFFKDLFIHSGDLDGSRHWPFLGAGLCSWGSVHRTAWYLNRDLVNPHSIPVRKCSHHPHFTVEQMEEQRGDITWPKSPSWYVARWGFELRLPGSSF